MLADFSFQQVGGCQALGSILLNDVIDDGVKLWGFFISKELSKTVSIFINT